jgi:hypothetical protein
MAPAFNTDAYCQVGSRVPSPIASGSRATLPQSCKGRVADHQADGIASGLGVTLNVRDARRPAHELRLAILR